MAVRRKVRTTRERPSERVGEAARADRRPDYHHGDLRAALVAAATELVRLHGAAGFSLREAARQVGVDPAACYRHFRDRQELLIAIAQRGFADFALSMATAMKAAASRSYEERFVAMAQSYVRFASEHPAEFRVMFGDSGTHARDLRLRLPEVERSAYQQLEDLIEVWIRDEGVAVDPAKVAVAFWSGAHGVARLVVDGALAASSTEALAHVAEVSATLYRGFRAPPSKAKRARSIAPSRRSR